jgi:hypothetical protein
MKNHWKLEKKIVEDQAKICLYDHDRISYKILKVKMKIYSKIAK